MPPNVPEPPRIIPVLDVKGGQVVRAIAGQRDDYRPIESTLTPSTEPVAVAAAMIRAVAADTLYVADLDAIIGPAVETGWLAELADAFPRTRIWVDQGFRTPADLSRLPQWKRRNRIPIFGWDKRTNLVPVLGTETATPAAAYQAAREFAPDLAVSIDLCDGQLLEGWRSWEKLGVTGPAAISEMVTAALMASEAVSLIVLDIRRVGTGAGLGTEAVLGRLRQSWPLIELIAGGGVRGWEDIDRLGAIGVNGVLVASAIHNGTLTVPRPAS
jgi:phosphoribosylformimino-5-aminoimidazole carboxamide ribotide isomerase